MKKRNRSLDKIIWSSAGMAAFILVWVFGSIVLGSVRLPSPFDVLKVFFSILHESYALQNSYSGWFVGIVPHMLISVIKLLGGASIGIIFGVGVGFIMSSSQIALGLLDLPTRALRAIPPLAFVPFILVWFGTGTTLQVVLIALYVFIMLLTNTIEAVQHVKSAYLWFAASLGATKKEIFRDVLIHACMPEILSSARVSIAFSWGLVVVAELVGGRYGIGRVISFMEPLLLINQLIAVIIWVALVAILLDILLMKLSKILLRWK